MTAVMLYFTRTLLLSYMTLESGMICHAVWSVFLYNAVVINTLCSEKKHPLTFSSISP